MKHYFLMLMSISSLICIANEPQRTKIIPQASYLVYEKQNALTGGVPIESQQATFYTYNGIKLATVFHNHYFATMHKRLDPCARKPQPTSYRLTHLADHQNISGRIQAPGYYLIFFDKNHNAIKPAYYLGLSEPSAMQIKVMAAELDLSALAKKIRNKL